MNQCDGCRAGWEVRNGLHYDRHGKVQMTCTATRYQPKALRLADALDFGDSISVKANADNAAAELRRLHAENEALRESLRTEELISFRRQMQQYAAQVEADESLLRQALEMMEESHYAVANQAPHADVMAHYAVIEALRERLGVKE